MNYERDFIIHNSYFVLAQMTSYIIRRLLILPFTLFGLSLLIFTMLQLLDPATRAALYIRDIPKTREALQLVIHKYGLDQPIIVQYFDWLGRIIHGDFGWSV